MNSLQKFARDVFSRDQAFENVFIANGALFVVRKVDYLTAIVSPSLRKRGKEIRVYIEFGLVNVGYDSSPFQKLQKLIDLGDYVFLPKTIPSAKSLEMYIEGDQISVWLSGFIRELLEQYTLDETEAKILL